MSRQPIWKTLHSLGDRGVIYLDETGVYAPEVELWEEYTPGQRREFSDDECASYFEEKDRWCRATRDQHTVRAGGWSAENNGEACDRFTCDYRNRKRFIVYRFCLDQFSDADEVEQEWFSSSLDSCASSVNKTREDLIAAFCSDDPIARYWAYDAVASYFGLEEFDNDYLDLSEKELEERIDAQDAEEKARKAQVEKKHRVALLNTSPHARCEASPVCVEHALDKRVPSCKPKSTRLQRGRGRKLQS